MSELNCFVERSRSGGFALSAEGSAPIRVTPADAGWTVDGAGRLGGARLTRAPAGGFVLCASGGEEVGRTSRLSADDAADRGSTHVLLEDGRLYRIAGRHPAEAGLDLCGWETPGAYLTARPEDRGWRIASTAAGTAMPPSDVLPLLFAAELLDAEHPLGAERVR